MKVMQTFFKLVLVVLVSSCTVSVIAEEDSVSEEQLTSARQLAADLGVVLKEDKDKNVILLDTAAKRSWVNDFQMQEMLVFPKLQRLTVEGPSITDQLAPSIAKLPELTTLAMRNTLISDAGIAQLAELNTLKIIDLRLSPLVTDQSARVLASIPTLRAVRISGVNITDAGIQQLLKLPQLTELDVRNCRGVTSDSIASLADKKSLRVLKIGGGTIDDSVLELVAGMKQLANLSLDNCNISDEGVEKLSQLKLKDLTIYQAPGVTDSGLSILSSFNELKSLTLRDISANCGAIGSLPHPEKIRTLNVAQSKITDEQVQAFAKLTGIEKLILNETAITDASVESLASLQSLKYLEATQTQLTGEGANRLRTTLPKCTIRVD